MKSTLKASIRGAAGLAFAGLALAACQTTQVEEAAVTQPLAPMAEPAPYAEGTVFHGIRNGEPVRNTLIAVNGDRYTWQRDADGCTWTMDAGVGLRFGPEANWENCNSSGTTSVTNKSGDIWPLEVGKTVSYEGTDHTVGGNDWSADRTCEVEGQARVTTHAGTYDTYKVVCRTKWREMISYMSPDVGAAVRFVQRPTRSDSNSPGSDFELTRIDAK